MGTAIAHQSVHISQGIAMATGNVNKDFFANFTSEDEAVELEQQMKKLSEK